MEQTRYVGVIDIGKTNAKFAVVDLSTRSEIAIRKTPNLVLADGPYPHFDVDGLWHFLNDAIAELNREYPLDALSVTTHGAAAALVDDAGELALPILDYEFSGPDAVDAEYAAVRPAFSESFTPPLPGGLNLGKQLFWQSRRFPEAFARTRWVLPYPQYWSFRLTGVAAGEITSLGCHTDLWDFRRDRLSSLVEGKGWIGRMPPLRRASDILGPLRQELARALGLPADLPVHCGIHDSNASLLPHLLERTPPFAVVSTGTWVIVCAPGGDLAHLDPARDSLANIDALGRHVPAARFMGGREFSQLLGAAPGSGSAQAARRVLEDAILLLPSITEGSGPFPHRPPTWTHPRNALGPETLFVTVSYYLAMMTAECLALTGAAGEILVEGPFANNPHYLSMLHAATSRPVVASTSSATGTSIGAALLADMDRHRASIPPAPQGVPAPALVGYARKWRQAMGGAKGHPA